MKIKLDQEFWEELFNYYRNKSVSDSEFQLGPINCWAFLASGNEAPCFPKDTPIFEFCYPFARPVYAVINDETREHYFDTVKYAIGDSQDNIRFQRGLRKEKQNTFEREPEDKCCA